MAKTALLFGSTGMIGSYLLQELLADADFTEVKAFVRKPLSVQHPKLKSVLTDFSNLDTIKEELKGEAVFCCLGTTTAQTPDKEGRRKVDHDIPVYLAMLAEGNKVPCFIIVSSVGASAGSSNFYLKNKGEMETEVGKRDIKQIVFLRPSFLMGERNSSRAGEGIFTGIFRLFSPLLLGSWSKYRPVHGLTVARAMKKFANKAEGNFVLHYNEIRQIMADQFLRS
ncbi:MAG: NAD(P)H-binding protein [Bacteroidia bacterium]